ncbi:MAG: hypothetical protein RL308_347 [Bacteroidota bacterium]|jgi:hypothetical protein
MKFIAILFFVFVTANLTAQSTFVPDDIFEAYLETHNSSGIPVSIGNPTSMGNGISNDNYVLTSRINTVAVLQVINLGISDLTGIESFQLLSQLNCSQNNLVSVNVSQNAALQFFYCSYNNISSLNLSQNIALKNLKCSLNELTDLDLSNNPLLTELWCDDNQIFNLNISENNLLTRLVCTINQLQNLDVSHCSNMGELYCGSNQLNCLNVATQTEYGMTLSAINNPNLTCIEVFNINFPPPSFASFLDPQMYYNEDCMNNCSSTAGIQELTSDKKLIKTTDLMGREINPNTQSNILLINYYDNGTFDKVFISPK